MTLPPINKTQYNRRGVCYGLGVGPGGVADGRDLITVAAAKILRRVPIVVAFRAVGKTSRAHGLVAPILAERKDVKVIDYPLTMARRAGDDLSLYQPLAQLIAEQLTAGQDVAVLCEGDPMFYGSFQYVRQLLIPTHRVVVVAGVSAVAYAAARSGITLGRGDGSLAILPAASSDEKIKTSCQQHDCVVIMKLGSHVARLKNMLASLGLMARATLFIDLGSMEEQIMPLADWHSDTAPYFSLVMITMEGNHAA